MRLADPARSVRPRPDAGLPSAAPRDRPSRLPGHGPRSEWQLLPAGSARTYRANCLAGYPNRATLAHTEKSERVEPPPRGSHRDSRELWSARHAAALEATSLCTRSVQLPLLFSGKRDAIARYLFCGSEPTPTTAAEVKATAAEARTTTEGASFRPEDLGARSHDRRPGVDAWPRKLLPIRHRAIYLPVDVAFTPIQLGRLDSPGSIAALACHAMDGIRMRGI